MRKLYAFAAVMVVCATPALAQVDRPDRDCGTDPETTGALYGAPQGLLTTGERPDRVAVTPPEESWQEEAREEAERRRQRLTACGVD